MRFFLLIIYFSCSSCFVVAGQRNAYDSALSSLDVSDLASIKSHLLQLDKLDSSKYVLARGLQSSILLGCHRQLFPVDCQNTYKELNLKHRNAMVMSVISRLRKTDINGEAFLILAISVSGHLPPKETIDINDWLSGSKEEQYLEAARWVLFSVLSFEDYDRYTEHENSYKLFLEAKERGHPDVGLFSEMFEKKDS